MTHLEKFKKAFDHDRVRDFPGKLEYKVSDVDKAVDRARHIIAKDKLNLAVELNGSLGHVWVI